MSQRILVVEDEPDIAAVVAYNLARSNYRVSTATSGMEALNAAVRERPDLIILDVLLPEMSGYEVLEQLRARSDTRDTGVILLTALVSENDRVKGFSLGADDYLAKPFSPKELVLRVEAVLRRLSATPVSSGSVLSAGAIKIDRGAHTATVDDAEIELTSTEYRLLAVLLERRGRVQSRTQLLQDVWDASPDIETRTVDMHVQRLRSKLGSAADLVETVRGVGYRVRREAVLQN
jgi:two-component system phosphate regulon response regulator PhoB